ncbi:RHS repeat-associated core domain-containing protein [Longitalea luteola]|uniref:RHS repeat-associated core domain-containing protein n=1 Tax=Longitalea luteola TaxID=2812563 RepID=UPI001A979C65|nr:RHS repeat-associated core domain-containing protein [Longitalea luteola]
MQRTLYRLLFICTLLVCFTTVKAIDERYAAPELRGNQLAPDSTSIVMDTVYFNPVLKPAQTTWFVKNLITFKIDEAYRFVLPDAFNVTIKFLVHYTMDNNGTPVTGVSDTISLNINYTKLNTYAFKNTYMKDGWYKAEIEIVSINGGTNLSDYRDALVLTNEILVNREYNFSCTNNAVKSINHALLPANGELFVNWQPERAADEYDLEWTYVEHAAANNYRSGDQFEPKKVFAAGATRVSVTKEHYTIPLLFEGAGTLIFRVRAVQVKQNGQRIESVWSSDYAGGLGQYVFRGLDTMMNWQASTSFAEEGKRKSVVQYFDGSLKSRQTVTKDNTTDKAIIAETLYDHQGRPAIQVMPSPSLSSIIKYTPGFNRLNGEYTKDKYDGLLKDTCFCRQGAPAMNTDSGAALYYSPNNPLADSSYHKYIPDANGYVFAETKYTSDNTGRISVQGGVGEPFQLGKKHETLYTYNSAEQEELDALFGTEAGNARHYFKNTVQDANGQLSISYVDMHGRTIASALAGDAAVKLDNLTSNTSNLIMKKLLDSNSNLVKGTVIESSKGLLVTETGPHRFIYSLLPEGVSIKDCKDISICYDCVYDLSLTIAEECNDTTRGNGNSIVLTRNNYKIDTACNNYFPSLDTTLTLVKGSYLVTKTLTVNRQAMEYYRDSIFMQRNTCRSLQQMVQEQITQLQTSISCENACASCETEGLHVNIRQQMLADITPPMGQYAKPGNIDQYSVFYQDGNNQPAYKQVKGLYRDENGNEDPLIQNGITREQFIAEFKSSWAETLIEMHPEYPKLRKYEELAKSNSWDLRFQNTDSYQAAVDSGFLNPADFPTHPAGSIFAHKYEHRDPLFTDLYPGYKGRMQDSLKEKANDSGKAISMWSLATIMAHCPGGDNSCLNRYKHIDSAFAIGSECSGDRDIAWQYFREMYLQEKREIIAEILNAAQQAAEIERFRDLTELFDNHTPNFYDPNSTSIRSDIPPNEQAGRDSLNSFINNNCLAYVTQWWEELKPCDFNATDSLWIVPKLLTVCSLGGDSAHLFGASTVKPSNSYQFRSFEEVIKAYRALTGKSYNADCNAYLITAPLPYDQQPVYYEKPVYQKPDSCECATISSLYEQFEFSRKDSSFSDYIYRTTGTRIYQGVLDTLRMACDGQVNCSFLSTPISLPPVLQCGVKDVCVDCDRIEALNERFKASFPGVNPAIENTGVSDSAYQTSNRLYERFMNNHLGFSKTAYEYLTFTEQCGTENLNGSCGTLGNWLSEFKKYSGIPHLDASGSDTTHWKVTFFGWDYNVGVPLGEVIKNGVMGLPGYYADTLVNKNAAFEYLRDTMCFDTTGFTWETRIRLPDSLAKIDGFGTIWWTYLYLNKEVGDILLTISPYDGQGTGVCTHLNDPLKSCVLQNPGLHLNDWTVLKMQFRGRNFKVYVGDILMSERTLDAPVSSMYHWSLAPRSAKGKVDYIRIYDADSTILYNENFDDAHNLAQISNKARCEPCGVRYTNYFNQRNNSNLSYASIDSMYHSCGVQLDPCEELKKLCGKTEPVFAPEVVKQHAACNDTTLFSHTTGVVMHEAYRDSLINSFNDRYLAKCLNVRYNERLTLYQPTREFHYTLYYYDQAGNLLKTIPPAGVDVSKFGWARAWSDSVTLARRNRQSLTPRHTLPTQYRYNTLNQVVAQQSPDGGKSEFWYDRLGRLAISRNARQKAAGVTEQNRLYSYTKYDSLGRITEVGQVSNTDANGAMTNAISRNQGSLNNWLNTLHGRRGQITNTVYDLPYPGFIGIGDMRQVITQKNLRNRVSYTTITDTGTSNAYNQGTFYTYDILGNVDQLLQDYGSSSFGTTANVMNKNSNRWKKISYQYDLVSGKVNLVKYQAGWRDGFFHRYSYDAENRLTLVETSNDSLVWEKDARYEYYRHGPLARVILGEQQVQGVDYAYTLQGWLKGINSSGGTDSFDMGQDGLTGSMNQYTAQDAIGLTLNYYGNDYTAISGHPFPGVSGYLPTNVYRPLYNGNISSSSVYQRRFELVDNNHPGGPLIFYNYKYDQLNRLTAQDAYAGNYNISTGAWNSLQSMGERLKERIVYDANGNIQKYLRKGITGTAAHMDSLNYFYYAGTNRLKHISDSIAANAYTTPGNRIIDIDGQSDSNYVYDAIGNLIKDKKENITDIKWNVYGKIQEITRTPTAEVPASNIKYTYDALGNRIGQEVTSGATKYYSWYVRDGQGNLLSTYTAEGSASDLSALVLKQTEKHLFGSSRLGYVTMGTGVNFDGGPGNTQFYFNERKFNYERGHKQYELTNHLGNVLATVSDRKFGVSSAGSSLIDHYDPHIVTAQDYYPFGMLSRVALPNSGVPYKFGFNGKMNDNEVKGMGNQQDYGMRIYDARVGRFLSVDPLTKGYPELTPYQFASNSPIAGIDQDGLEFLGAGWLIDKASEGLSKLGMPRTAGFVSSYGHSVIIDPAYSNYEHVQKIRNKQYIEAAKDYDPTGLTRIPDIYRTGVKAFSGDKNAQGQLLGMVPGVIGGIKAYRAATGKNAVATATEAATIETQVAANSGNSGAAKTVNVKKPFGYDSWGGETLDDAIRTKEQAFDPTPPAPTAQPNPPPLPDLVGFRKAHILNRHKPGAGKAGKTEFPSSWSDQRIIDEVNKIANDPNAAGGVGLYNSPYKYGTVNGVIIRVDFYPIGHAQHAGKVSTAYPINTIPNP